MNTEEKVRKAIDEFCEAVAARQQAIIVLAGTNDRIENSSAELVRVLKSSGFDRVLYKAMEYYVGEHGELQGVPSRLRVLDLPASEPRTSQTS